MPRPVLPAAGPLRGTACVPGDKSLSHRAALFAPLGDGPARVRGFLRAQDTLRSLAAVRDLGADVRDDGSALTIGPGERATVGTGVSIALPEGCAAFVVPRSGLASKRGITIVNSPGTVDAGYRGEIMVNLINLDPREAFQVRRGDRVAQLVVQRVERVHFEVLDSLPDSSRGETGHGASGGFGQSALSEG